MIEYKNIYICSLEFAAKYFPDGISYNDLLKHLETLGKKPTGEFEEYFQHWFFQHFFEYNIYRDINRPQSGGAIDKSNYIPYLNKKLVMTSDAYFEHQEYMILQHTRKDAKDAKTIAIIAIFISIVIGLI